MWEEVEQKCTSMPSTPSILPSATSHAVVDGTTGGLDEIVGEGMGEQPPSKPRYVPRPPKHKRGKLKRTKVSTYDWKKAREELGVTHHQQVYSATRAATASTASTANATAAAIVNSPSKEEVKAENKKLAMQTYTLERRVETAKRKVDCLQTQVKSLSNTLKEEKIKSRGVIENLLIVTAAEHDTLLKSFHDNIVHIENEHNSSLRKITRDSNNMANDNKKAIDKLMKKHAKEIETISNKYMVDLTQVENRHNKTMVSLCE